MPHLINGANMHAQCTPSRICTTMTLAERQEAMNKAIANVPKAQPVKVQPVEVPIPAPSIFYKKVRKP